ncbi:hypothetical protein SCHPADRAFT_892309 [Schizopora paradoxa]|uniref:Nephrocystin 3-like N-terminal domain-containing protein n=1 Tax=Schizopora paradoxa TaxID=27342 RepID=A0A0H2RFZ1_9AGAM|nr:hypothetical protein SCHPADRAFT_892309 [Schizopora paradoxa]
MKVFSSSSRRKRALILDKNIAADPPVNTLHDTESNERTPLTPILIDTARTNSAADAFVCDANGYTQKQRTPVTVHKVHVEQNKGFKTPNRLSVSVAGKNVRTKLIKKANWKFEDSEPCVACEGDVIKLHLTYGKRKALRMKFMRGRRWDHKCELEADKAIALCGDNLAINDGETEYPMDFKDGKISVTVSVKLFDFEALRVLADNSSKDLDGEFSSSDVSGVKEALGQIFELLDSVQGFENVLKGISSIHPIASAAVSVAFLPYQLMKNESEFKGSLRDTVEKMRDLLRELKSVEGEAKLHLATDAIKECMKTAFTFMSYVCNFMDRKGLQRFAKAQLDGPELEDFAKAFDKNRDAFRNAINYQVAAGVNTLLDEAEHNKLEAERSKLERLLAPVSGPRPNDCYDGTREDILQQIKDWIGGSSENNILWISGAPGVGKSAISSSFVRHLEGRWEVDERNPFAVFYINRQASRDPRSIWRTVAYNLALSIADYRAHLLKTLREDTKGNGVTKQFEVLISVPIESLHQARRPGISETISVIVIDALDECLSEEDSEGDEFLDTIVGWKNLPSSWRLIVFSRREGPIVRRLQAKGVSNSIIIPSGDDVKYNSKASQDIQTYLKAKFDEISRKFDVKVTPWPQSEAVDQLLSIMWVVRRVIPLFD